MTPNSSEWYLWLSLFYRFWGSEWCSQNHITRIWRKVCWLSMFFQLHGCVLPPHVHLQTSLSFWKKVIEVFYLNTEWVRSYWEGLTGRKQATGSVLLSPEAGGLFQGSSTLIMTDKSQRETRQNEDGLQKMRFVSWSQRHWIHGIYAGFTTLPPWRWLGKLYKGRCPASKPRLPNSRPGKWPLSPGLGTRMREGTGVPVTEWLTLPRRLHSTQQSGCG